MVKRRIVIGISDGGVSCDPSDVLVTYSLGSCMGVCFYDPVIRAGAMLHCQLPASDVDAVRARDNPFMFADTGMEWLLHRLLEIGAHKERLQVKVAGGATMAACAQGFDIGKRNYLAVRKVLWSHGLFINAEDVGGTSPRNLYMDMADGGIVVRSNGLERQLC